jgi:outer membrane protein assembly factor BamA
VISLPAILPPYGLQRARILSRYRIVVLTLFIASISGAQQTPTQSPQQTPRTAPQVQETLPTYEGQNVSSVELAGRPDLDTSKYISMLSQREGQPFSQARVNQTIAALKTTGQFNDVQLQVLPEANGIRVLFVLQPAMYYGVYEFPGATRQYSYARLLQISDYPPQGPYTARAVQRAEEALQAHFSRTGFFLARVTPELRIDKEHGLVNISFRTDLGERARFGEVAIKGATPEETDRMEGAVHSFMARLRGSAIRKGKTYKLKTLQNATRYLESGLNKQGYLGAKVRLIGAAYNRETNRADVTFTVQTGPKIHVKVEGAHLWPWTRKRLIPIYQQIGIDPELIQEGRQNLISYFQSKGYFETKVDAQVVQHSPGETVLYHITKGPRHKVRGVEISGNQHLSDKNLLSAVKVQKAPRAWPFGHGKYSQTLVRTSVNNLKGVYQAAGFSEVKITPEIQNRNGDISVTFRVDEGPRDLVEALNIEGNSTVPVVQLAPKGLQLGPGKPYSAKLVDQDRREIMARYLNLGYLTAAFRASAQQVEKDSHRLNVVYRIYEGPQVRTATVVTLGRQQTKQKLIDREIANLGPGRPLREGDMLTAGSQLYTSGVFDWAQVDPRRQITTQTQEDVVVKVHESKRNQIIYGFGFEVINRGGSVPSGTVAVPGLPPIGLPSSFKTSEKTFWGPRGTFEYTRKNLLGAAESLTLSAVAGRLDQRGNITYTDPSLRWTNWTASLIGSAEHNSQNPIFTARLGQVTAQMQHPLNPDRTQNFLARYSFNVTDLTRLLIPDLVPPEDQHVRLSTLSGTYIRDTRDLTLDAHKGIYETLELDFNPSALGSSVSFSRLLGQAAYYKSLHPKIIWANSLRLGFAKAFAGSHVPVSETFFTGGGSTLRGFPLNGAGPQRTIPACGTPGDPSTCSLITVPVGGNELLILNSEFRFPDVFKPIPLPFGVNNHLGVAVFYDGGNVFPRIGFHGQYTNSIGGGLRYSTPIGPIRIDIGHNLNAVPGIKSTQIFVTLGQAF